MSESQYLMNKGMFEQAKESIKNKYLGEENDEEYYDQN